MAIAHQKKGERREALRILKDTPVKYFLLGLPLAYLAELGTLLWFARKFRISGAGALSPWRFGDLFTFAGLFIILQSGILLLSLALPFSIQLSDMMLGVVCSGVCALSFALVLKARGSTLVKAFALDVSMPWKPFVAWTVLTVAGGMVAFGYSFTWLCRLDFKLNERFVVGPCNFINPTGLELAVVFLVGALMAPVLEEILFRGIVYQSLRTKAQPWLAIPVSAAIFAAIHLDKHAFLPIFVFGCALAYALERTKSLRLPITIHCLNNAIGLTYALMAHR